MFAGRAAAKTVRTGLRVAAASLCLATSAAMADTLPQVMRYRCTTISGDVRVVAQDLARVFPAAMRGCTAFSVSAAAPIEPRHAVALPAPAPTIIRNGLAADEVSWSAAPAFLSNMTLALISTSWTA